MQGYRFFALHSILVLVACQVASAWLTMPLITTAVVASALLFALGHLPAAQALAGALTVPVVVFVLVGNTAFGLVAGWLYARHGLEAAILAHVLAHLLSSPLL